MIQPIVFDRVCVDYLVMGGARIQWEINEHFQEAGPWTFQLQVAEANVPNANWTDVGAPVVGGFIQTDPNQEWFGKEPNTFYRVQLVTGVPNTYYSAPQDVWGNLTWQNWSYAQELTRKEILRLQYLEVGIEGYFLKRMHTGLTAAKQLDPLTEEVIDSGSIENYSTEWEGGYYTAVPCVFGDINTFDRYNERSVEDTRGMINTQITKGIFVAAPFMSMNDVWVNKTSDLRYWIHKVTVLTHIQGVPIVTSVELRPIPTDNAIYKFPVPPIPTPARASYLNTVFEDFLNGVSVNYLTVGV